MGKLTDSENNASTTQFCPLKWKYPGARTWSKFRNGTETTDRPVVLWYNFSVSDTLTWMVNFPTRIPDYDFHSPAYLISFFLEKEPYYSKNIVDV